MKRFLLLAVMALAFGTAAPAQTALPADSPVTFSVPLSVAAYVAGVVPKPDVLSALAVATNGITDSNAAVTITVTQGQIVDLFKVITRVPEGVGAEPNKVLLYAVFPKLPGRPWLAEQVGKLRAENEATFSRAVADGLRQMETIQSALNRNQK